jgi:hypothetical protein
VTTDIDLHEIEVYLDGPGALDNDLPVYDHASYLLAEVRKARLALRNVLALSHRIRKTDTENADHLVRFCASAGVEATVLRAEPCPHLWVQYEGANGPNRKELPAGRLRCRYCDLRCVFGDDVHLARPHGGGT